MTHQTPKHIVRLLLLLGFLLLVSLAAKIRFTDPSYYRFGYYRADAVPELAAGRPLYLGSPYCQKECHEERYADWPVGAHKTVQCEVCHGPDPEHPDDEVSLIPNDPIRLCSTCHQAMPARPAAQPQIVLDEHPFADGQIMPCTECHDPHAPGPVLRVDDSQVTPSATQAMRDVAGEIPAVASKCTKCHGKQGEGIKRNPALAGLEAAVFIDKMRGYRSGAGGSKIMTRFAKALSDEEITELSAYYEGLPKQTAR